MPPKQAQPQPQPQPANPKPLGPLPLPSTVEEWYAREDHPLRLRELLADPVMALAMATLLERARPTQWGIADPSANAASLLGWYAGYCDAIADLRRTLINPARIASPLYEHPTGAVPRGTMRHAEDEEPWAYLGVPGETGAVN
jgi:hypothetical protein